MPTKRAHVVTTKNQLLYQALTFFAVININSNIKLPDFFRVAFLFSLREAYQPFSFEKKVEYVNSVVGKKCKAIVENSHNLSSQDVLFINCVTENFLHCKIKVSKGDTIPHPSEEIEVRIEKPLIQEMKDGQEYDVLASIC